MEGVGFFTNGAIRGEDQRDEGRLLDVDDALVVRTLLFLFVFGERV